MWASPLAILIFPLGKQRDAASGLKQGPFFSCKKGPLEKHPTGIFFNSPPKMRPPAKGFRPLRRTAKGALPLWKPRRLLVKGRRVLVAHKQGADRSDSEDSGENFNFAGKQIRNFQLPPRGQLPPRQIISFSAKLTRVLAAGTARLPRLIIADFMEISSLYRKTG